MVYIFYAPYIFFYFLSSMENGKETRNTSKHNIQHSTFNIIHSSQFTLPHYPGTRVQYPGTVPGTVLALLYPVQYDTVPVLYLYLIQILQPQRARVADAHRLNEAEGEDGHLLAGA